MMGHLSEDARGADLVEYIAVVGTVALVAVVGARVFGGSVDHKIRCLAARVAGGDEACTAAATVAPNGARIDPLGAAGDDRAPKRLPEDLRQSLSQARLVRFSGQPFVAGKGDGTAVHPSDVTQGMAGDCFFMATLAAVAAREPKLIENMIKDNGDGTYSVTFQMRHPSWWQVWEPSSSTVVVKPEFPVLRGAPLFAQAGDADGKGGAPEIWPMLLEKAYAELHGGYLGLDRGGYPVEVTLALTGNMGRLMWWGVNSFEDVAGEWKAGHAIVAGTIRDEYAKDNPLFNRTDGKPPLATNHAYYVTDVDEKNRTITLRNPKGWDHGPTTLTWEEFKSVIEYAQTTPTNDHGWWR